MAALSTGLLPLVLDTPRALRHQSSLTPLVLPVALSLTWLTVVACDPTRGIQYWLPIWIPAFAVVYVVEVPLWTLDYVRLAHKGGRLFHRMADD